MKTTQRTPSGRSDNMGSGNRIWMLAKQRTCTGQYSNTAAPQHHHSNTTATPPNMHRALSPVGGLVLQLRWLQAHPVCIFARRVQSSSTHATRPCHITVAASAAGVLTTVAQC